MRTHIFKPFIFSAFLLLYSVFSQANVELLETAPIPSDLVSTSIITSLTKSTNEGVLAVGERGHLISWQSQNNYHQEISPVSLLLTDVTILSNGTKLAVGHDGAIISSPKDTETWNKLFDGFDLIKLKIALLEKQIAFAIIYIESLNGEDEIEDASFALEDLEFALEDAKNAQSTGPNLPLLSVTQTKSDVIIITGAYGTLLKSVDFGRTWHLSDDLLNNPDKYHLNSITSNDSRTYIVGEQGRAYASQDNGNSWQSINTPYNGSLFGILSQKKSTNLITFGLKGNYFISRDQGKHWQGYVSENRATLLGGHINENGDVILVGHGGTIIKLNINTPNKTSLIRHPSGSAFSAVTVINDQLIIVGQFGIVSVDNSMHNPFDNSVGDKGVSQ